jgi:serine/threonine protein kinase
MAAIAGEARQISVRAAARASTAAPVLPWKQLLLRKEAAAAAAAEANRENGRALPAERRRMSLQRSHTIIDDVVWDTPKRVSIGSGRYGTVYRSALGGWRGLTVAVKEERAEQMRKGKWDVAHMKDEVEMLEVLRHPNLVMYLGSDMHEDESGGPPLLSIVTEYCAGGSLYEALHESGPDRPLRQALTDTESVRAARQIGSAVQMLHTHRPSPIVHRDLTSSNVMLSRSRDAKVGDFGLARTLKKEDMRTTWAGTPEYMAPEHWRGEPLTPAVDVFSFGVILWELITREVPWGLASDYEILMAVDQGKRLTLPPRSQLPSCWPSATPELIEGCWAHAPEDRPTMCEAVELLGHSDELLYSMYDDWHAH